MSIASQPPTLFGYQVQKIEEARIIFHAIYLGLLNMVARRLDTEERRHIQPGCIYVWEERGQGPETTGLGIERWTDSIHWGPSRVRDEFLYYQERRIPTIHDVDISSDSDSATLTSDDYPRMQGMSMQMRSNRPLLVKQTYSVYVQTSKGRRKWHLIAYLTQQEQPHLYTVWDNPQLSRIQVPDGMYRSARICRRPNRNPRPQPPSTTCRLQPQREESSKQPPMSAAHFQVDADPRDQHKLAPLEFLRTLCPPRRHIIDEMALIQVSSTPLYSGPEMKLDSLTNWRVKL